MRPGLRKLHPHDRPWTRAATHPGASRFTPAALARRLSRIATRALFSAFGYALLTDAAPKPPERTDYLYVEFGREAVPGSGLH